VFFVPPLTLYFEVNEQDKVVEVVKITHN